MLSRFKRRFSSKSSSPTDRLEFHVDRLENRQMLAGDVLVRVTPLGDMTLTGDNFGNEIAIEAGEFGGIRVSGLNGTTINGESIAFDSEAVDDLRINLKNGDNAIRVDGAELNGSLNVVTGINDDSILVLGDTKIGNDIVISTRRGDDLIHFASVDVVDDVRVNTSTGNDDVYWRDLTVGDDVNAILGGGDDKFGLSAWVDIPGSFRVNAGANNDFVGFNDFHQDIGTGGVNTPIFVALGGGDDTMHLGSSTVLRNSTLLTGGGGFDTLNPSDGFSTSEVMRKLAFEEESSTSVDHTVATMNSSVEKVAVATGIVGGFERDGQQLKVWLTDGDDDAVAAKSTGAGNFLRINGMVFRYAEDEVTMIDVYGLAGDDSLRSDLDSLELFRAYGGAGDDYLRGSDGIDHLYGQDGSDGLYGEGGQDRMWGGNGDDGLYGGDNNDHLDGGAGNDYMRGGSGNDHMYGLSGDDYMYGEDGYDVLEGGDGNDLLRGDAHDDQLKGGDGDDTLYGDDGQDRLWGDNGNDWLFGNDGQDRMWGSNGNDRLYGGNNNDHLDGGAGHDYMYGGSANDRMYGLGGNDHMYGGDGYDYLEGGAGNDRLEGEAGDDRLYGGDGDDSLYGGDRNDSLYGGSGNDGLFGGIHGNDRLEGGSGKDRILVLGTSETLVDINYSEDALIRFTNSAGESANLGGENWEFTAGYWVDSEIEAIDVALRNVQHRVGNTKLLKTRSGGQLTFKRVGAQVRTGDDIPNWGGWNSGNGTVAYTDRGLRTDFRAQVTVYHELAHNWDEVHENRFITAFHEISHWDQTFEPGDTASTSPADHWFFRDSPDNFAREYGMFTRFEDYATTWETYFSGTYHDRLGANGTNSWVTSKIQNVISFLNNIATA